MTNTATSTENTATSPQPSPLSPDHPGYFDIKNPWAEGTVLLSKAPRWWRLVEVNLEHETLTIEYGGAGDKATMPIASWNRDVEWGGAVTRVMRPEELTAIPCRLCVFEEGNEREITTDAGCPNECHERAGSPGFIPTASLWPEGAETTAAQESADNPTDEPDVAEKAETLQTATPEPSVLSPDPIICCECKAPIVEGAECVQDDGQFCCVSCDAVVNRPHLTDSQERRLFTLTHQIIQHGTVIRRHEGFVESAKVNLADCKKDLSDAMEKRRTLEAQVMEILTDAEKGQGNLIDVIEDVATDREKAYTAIVTAAGSDEVKAFELIAASNDDELMVMVIERADTEVKISANVVDAADKRLAEIMKQVDEEPQNDMHQHLLKSLLGATEKGALDMIANSNDPVWLNLIAKSIEPKVLALSEKVLDASADRRDVLLKEAAGPTEEEAAAEASLKAGHEEWMKTKLSTLIDPAIPAGILSKLEAASPRILTIGDWCNQVEKQTSNDKPINWGLKGIGEAATQKIEDARDASLSRFNMKK